MTNDVSTMLNSIFATLDAAEKNSGVNPKFAKPIDELAEKLKAENIECTVLECYDGKQMRFHWTDADVVCHSGSYGSSSSLLEIMGSDLLTEEETEYDSVKGYLSVDDVFSRIMFAYDKHTNKQ